MLFLDYFMAVSIVFAVKSPKALGEDLFELVNGSMTRRGLVDTALSDWWTFAVGYHIYSRASHQSEGATSSESANPSSW